MTIKTLIKWMEFVVGRWRFGVCMEIACQANFAHPMIVHYDAAYVHTVRLAVTSLIRPPFFVPAKRLRIFLVRKPR